MKKLSLEESEDLRDLVSHDGIKPLLSLIDSFVHDFETDVLKHPLDPNSAQELLFKKARLEGAGKLAYSIRTRLDAIRKKS